MKKASLIVAGLAAVFVWVGATPQASAQEAQPEPQPTEQTSAPAPTQYEFIAQPGNSMSVMARRAVQLYDQKTEAVNLPEPCIVMAETNIVQNLGPRWLAVEENFKIDESLVADFAQKANNLTEEQRAAWKVYSDNAEFNLTDVKLASEVVAAQNAADGISAEGESNSGDQASTTDQNSADTTNESQSGTTNGSAPWYWWVVGAGTIGALYYLLGGRPKPKESSSSK